jgi:uncharacterized cofD-like protein
MMDRLRRFYMWLLPGMKVKRWLFVSWIGLTLFSMGLILYVRVQPLIKLEIAIADFINRHTGLANTTLLVDVTFMITGLMLFFLGIRQWFVSIYREVVPDRQKNLVEMIYEKRQLIHGIKVVSIGGGTGLSTLLRGLKKFTSNITAVVTVADDGGSSGRLRREMGVLPPGDIRNCLVALADEENLMSALFQYRFADGDCLGGHNFGNLFLVAMTNIAGDFDTAIKQVSNILAIRGRVLPATLSPVSLCAVMDDGDIVEGETSITGDGRRVEKLYLEPADCNPPVEVIQTLEEADIIILGPGSLYTSVIPNLLIEGVVDAINKSKAVKVYICNVMTQPGETDGFSASDHIEALIKHTEGLKIDYCIVNGKIPPAPLLEKYKLQNQYPVTADIEKLKKMNIEPILATLISTDDLVRHNPEQLAELIIKLVEQCNSQVK